MGAWISQKGSTKIACLSNEVLLVHVSCFYSIFVVFVGRQIEVVEILLSHEGRSYAI